jgi:1,4-alpha-glucan branching enzyme
MEFILALHSHLPYVLNHGRWPHGSDWLCEAALDTYLPLLERLEELAAEETPTPVTIGFTPVLANQLASPAFAREMEEFFGQRLAACDEAPASFGPLVEFWRARFNRLRDLFRRIDANLVAAFRRLQEQGRLEIIGSAATHGYLPLLGRDESIRLQLAVGQHEHRRLFGVAPAGCWLPECAYRPRGKWRGKKVRRGIEQHLADAGFRYFFTDAHLARAGSPLGAYGDIPLGAERFDADRHDPGSPLPAGGRARAARSPYRAYRVSGRGVRPPVAALVRDPRSSMQIWSRHQGYPGDEWYLEFHKIRWPGGLKLWRVSGANVDLGGKRPYEPPVAHERAAGHASHFVHLLQSLAQQPADREGSGIIVAPFDTELFGHWWFEGADFLAATYRALRGSGKDGVRAVTASQHLEAHAPGTALQLAEGSWGANGDHSMWLNERTAWTWERLWRLEDAFWDVAPEALASAAARPVLAQAARELLLAQASDWQFIISTGAVVDYAERRFTLHCDDAERLIKALAGGELEAAGRVAEELARRDDLFPNVLAQVAEALAG